MIKDAGTPEASATYLIHNPRQDALARRVGKSPKNARTEEEIFARRQSGQTPQ
jgi:hypothetical protein